MTTHGFWVGDADHLQSDPTINKIQLGNHIDDGYGDSDYAGGDHHHCHGVSSWPAYCANENQVEKLKLKKQNINLFSSIVFFPILFIHFVCVCVFNFTNLHFVATTTTIIIILIIRISGSCPTTWNRSNLKYFWWLPTTSLLVQLLGCKSASIYASSISISRVMAHGGWLTMLARLGPMWLGRDWTELAALIFPL